MKLHTYYLKKMVSLKRSPLTIAASQSEECLKKKTWKNFAYSAMNYRNQSLLQFLRAFNTHHAEKRHVLIATYKSLAAHYLNNENNFWQIYHPKTGKTLIEEMILLKDRRGILELLEDSFQFAQKKGTREIERHQKICFKAIRTVVGTPTSLNQVNEKEFQALLEFTHPNKLADIWNTFIREASFSERTIGKTQRLIAHIRKNSPSTFQSIIQIEATDKPPFYLGSRHIQADIMKYLIIETLSNENIDHLNTFLKSTIHAINHLYTTKNPSHQKLGLSAQSSFYDILLSADSNQLVKLAKSLIDISEDDETLTQIKRLRFDDIFNLKKHKDNHSIDFYHLSLVWYATIGIQSECQLAITKINGHLPSESIQHLNPIGYAAKGGHDESLKTLYSVGFDPFTPDENGRTPLYWAVKNNYQESIKILHQYAQQNNINFGHAFFASHNGHPTAIDVLMQQSFESIDSIWSTHISAYDTSLNTLKKTNTSTLILASKSDQNAQKVGWLMTKGFSNIFEKDPETDLSLLQTLYVKNPDSLNEILKVLARQSTATLQKMMQQLNKDGNSLIAMMIQKNRIHHISKIIHDTPSIMPLLGEPCNCEDTLPIQLAAKSISFNAFLTFFNLWKTHTLPEERKKQLMTTSKRNQTALDYALESENDKTVEELLKTLTVDQIPFQVSEETLSKLYNQSKFITLSLIFKYQIKNLLLDKHHPSTLSDKIPFLKKHPLPESYIEPLNQAFQTQLDKQKGDCIIC